MTSLTTARRRSQAWSRPGRYFPVRHIQGVEVLDQPRGGVGVNGTTLHGAAEELRDLASQLLLVAYRMGAEPVRRQPQPVDRSAA
ncbi:hypothetical protein OG417_21350 [Actinoallomurus sp. NBC_01490]|uniref:hypothetical protein n=1 Tax=Actinoallomurus sp. NBC_01490 TaxID=2903557 RepID=UPI002E324B99|nr:hypothetical protein [Actinoallomurus sp. NBC_01490]